MRVHCIVPPDSVLIGRQALDDGTHETVERIVLLQRILQVSVLTHAIERRTRGDTSFAAQVDGPVRGLDRPDQTRYHI